MYTIKPHLYIELQSKRNTQQSFIEFRGKILKKSTKINVNAQKNIYKSEKSIYVQNLKEKNIFYNTKWEQSKIKIQF